MRTSLKPLLVIFGCVVLLAAISIARRTWRAKELVPWRTDFEAAVAEARSQRKPILLYFGAVWCGPCEEMKHTTFADPYVAEAMSRLMPIKIDVDSRPDLSREFGVWGLPRFMMFHPDRAAPKIIEGGLSPTELISWMARPYPDGGSGAATQGATAPTATVPTATTQAATERWVERGANRKRLTTHPS